jgi:2-deoxy-D-gluconate 3-dehydrogenase
MATTSFNLSGKIALVTGCNKGIGKAMAIGLAEAGADIIGVSGSLESSGSDIENKQGSSACFYQ